jgi:hypothetical protein
VVVKWQQQPLDDALGAVFTRFRVLEYSPALIDGEAIAHLSGNITLNKTVYANKGVCRPLKTASRAIL